jgi:hypothetical protein
VPENGQPQGPEVLGWARVMSADEVVSKTAPVEEILGVIGAWRSGERQ